MIGALCDLVKSSHAMVCKLKVTTDSVIREYHIYNLKMFGRVTMEKCYNVVMMYATTTILWLFGSDSQGG